MIYSYTPGTKEKPPQEKVLLVKITESRWMIQTNLPVKTPYFQIACAEQQMWHDLSKTLNIVALEQYEVDV